MAGPLYHLSSREAYILEAHREKINNITLGDKRSLKGERNKRRAIENILNTFPELRDRNPSNRVEHLSLSHERQRTEDFDARSDKGNEYGGHVHSRTTLLGLPDECDLDIVTHSTVYSATQKVAESLSIFQEKHLYNIDPNDTNALQTFFNKVNDGEADELDPSVQRQSWVTRVLPARTRRRRQRRETEPRHLARR